MSAGSRTPLEVIDDLIAVTEEMIEKRSDLDFLLSGVDKRQALMDEYDRLLARASVSDSEKAAIRQKKDAILEMDKKINDAFTNHRDHLKQDLQNANSQQKILSYGGIGLPHSGNIMDYKK